MGEVESSHPEGSEKTWEEGKAREWDKTRPRIGKANVYEKI